MDIQGMERMNQQLMDNVGKVIVGKEHTIELVMTAIIASGHVLLEDVPGTGENDARQIGSLLIGLHIPAYTVHTGLAAI